MAKRAGKYAHVIDHLPRLVGDDPDRRAVVDQVKSEVLAPPQGGEVLARELDVLRGTAMIDAHFTELIRLLKRSTAGRRWASEFARAYADARDLKEAVEQWQKSANLLVEVFQELMVDQMEQEGTASIRLESGRAVSTYMEPYPQVVDKAAFRDWCLADPDLRSKMMLWPSTTAALVKERLLAGEEEPPGVTCFAKTAVRLQGK